MPRLTAADGIAVCAAVVEPIQSAAKSRKGRGFTDHIRRRAPLTVKIPNPDVCCRGSGSRGVLPRLSCAMINALSTLRIARPRFVRPLRRYGPLLLAAVDDRRVHRRIPGTGLARTCPPELACDDPRRLCSSRDCLASQPSHRPCGSRDWCPGPCRRPAESP
jgi:hypothetical protein